MPAHQPSPVAGFHHVALRTRDFDRSLAFYTQVMRFPVQIAWGDKPKRAVMLDIGNRNYIEIFERPEQAPSRDEAQLLHLALWTDDCDAAIARVRAAGCEVTMEPKSIDIPSQPVMTPVRIGFFKGPDGEVVEFFQMRE